MAASTTTVKERRVAVRQNYESVAWKWMRYSAVLLIPLAWGHVLIQDVLVGVYRIDLNYVALRWATLFWRVYDVLLLAFTFAHGMNGLRQVLADWFPALRARQTFGWIIFIVWAVITAIGGTAIIGGVR